MWWKSRRSAAEAPTVPPPPIIGRPRCRPFVALLLVATTWPDVGRSQSPVAAPPVSALPFSAPPFSAPPFSALPAEPATPVLTPLPAVETPPVFDVGPTIAWPADYAFDPAVPSVTVPSATVPSATGPSASTPSATGSSASEATLDALANRVAELESRLKMRDEADRNSADAAAKKFSVRPFGLIQVDTGTFSQDADNVAVVGEARNGVDIRRAWLGCEGEGFEVLFYRFNVDFTTFDASTQGRPVIFDAFLDVRQLPLVGNLRIGHFREPFSLERLTSSIDIPLLERSAAINTLAPFRNIGIMAFDWNERETMTWAYGLFAEDTNEFGEDYRDRAGVAATGRVTWLPWYDEYAAGRYLLHVGSSGSYRRLGDERRRFATPPEAIFKEGATRTPNFVDTGILPLGDYLLHGVEFTTVLGSLSLQGEYAWLYGDLTTGRSVFFHGGYLEASYLLTGENRNYNRRLGFHGPVTPYSNFFRVRTDGGIATGPGAWEATARVSTFDLNDGPAAGGKLDNVTLGLTWNYAVRCRVMFNYIHAFLDRGGRDSDADIVATRFQYAF